MDKGTIIYNDFMLMAGITTKMRKNVESVLKTKGLTYPQFGALFTLMEKSGITQKELAIYLETDTTTAMVICDSLEKKKFIRRVADKSDRRVNRLEVTDFGCEVMEAVSPEVKKLYIPLMSSMTNDEWEMLESCLKKINNAVCLINKD